MKFFSIYIMAIYLAGLSLLIFSFSKLTAQEDPISLTFLRTLEHSREAFTQGLVFGSNAVLYESTGQYGRSTLRSIDKQSGQINFVRPIANNYFSEGITAINGKIIMLTWRSGLAFQFDESSLNLERTFRFDGEGWGLANDGELLILSDGTYLLRFYNPENFQLIKSLRVTENNVAVVNINELEYIDGEIWANIWHQDYIVRIDPMTGEVIGRIYPSEIYPRNLRNRESVLNGIAYDESTREVYLTGKYWPSYYIYSLN